MAAGRGRPPGELIRADLGGDHRDVRVRSVLAVLTALVDVVSRGRAAVEELPEAGPSLGLTPGG